jgi:nucleoid DNA-binding protein
MNDKRKTPYNTLKDMPKNSGNKAFRQSLQNLKDTTGLSYEMLETLCRLFTRELADALVQNRVLEVPNLGSFYFERRAPDFTNKLKFKANKEFIGIYNNRGTDENNFIRSIKKSSSRDIRRDGGSSSEDE